MFLKKPFTLIQNFLTFYFHNPFVKRVLHCYFIRNRIELKANKELLRNVRKNLTYGTNYKPLVSVIIPTYNRSDLLVGRAIPSVLKQTYQNFEIIIVGDHCTDDTEACISRICDKRIKFHNLSKRGKYPTNPNDRWLVAGVVPANKALELAKGDWIANLDDDDEFSRDHLQILLNFALKQNFEMVYGIIQMEKESGKWLNVGSYPLQVGQICRMASLYHSKLKFFKYDINAWKYAEPADWNLWRRMKEAGVRIGFVNATVGKHYLERRRWGV